ncbi:VOC family protein [Roseateles violae]|uniref:VOC family protein n=1 Tax=Roseateles violae TaxID=3058042 RepID=A0ABT8DQT7_9BURK|nr:VOC family protein [Pelomonas sp. PFR6]MDN3920697.1 VOC family protein [Pelomonas sp. PFR6]
MNLNTPRVFVQDIAGAKSFYGGVLGLRIKADGESYGYCVFDAGSATLVVEEVPADAPQEDGDLVGRFTGLSFEVRSVQAAYEDLRSRGVSFSGVPEKQFWGGTLATLQDPSGNQLQIYEQPRA